MPVDKKDENPNVSIIHVKITEKYKRPRKIYLPSSCQNCSLDQRLVNEYDFSLERSVLSKINEWRQAKMEEISRREERLKSWNNMNQNPAHQPSLEAPNGDDSGETSTQTSEVVSCNYSTTTSVVSSTPSNILTPVYANHYAQPLEKPFTTKFNLSEFESDNSSPFDNMELKTINDMEVLASIMSTAKTEAMVDKVEPPLNNNSILNKNGYSWNKWDGYNPHSSQQYCHPSTSDSIAYGSPIYATSQSYLQSQWHAGGITSYGPAPQRPVEVFQETPGTFFSSTLDQLNMQSKNNSKSVPDLVLELKKDLRENPDWSEPRRKTKTPPPRPTLHTGLENWKPWPELESPRHAGPDSIDSLSHENQTLAQSIGDMGFPMSRVVRTIRKFNGNDKKVIEFLLQVQHLEEKKKNFPGDSVEKALHANNYDEDETLKHLEAAIVLLDLGFDADTVERILLENKNDRDAALDKLIT